MIKNILFFLVITIGSISCCDCKHPKTGVLVGRDSVTFIRKISRPSYDTFQAKILNADLTNRDMDALSAAYQLKVHDEPGRYSISQITLNTDQVQNYCQGHQSIRFIPTYFPPDPRNPGNPQDTVILMVGYINDDGVEHFDDINIFFKQDEPNSYPVFCPPPRGCSVMRSNP